MTTPKKEIPWGPIPHLTCAVIMISFWTFVFQMLPNDGVFHWYYIPVTLCLLLSVAMAMMAPEIIAAILHNRRIDREAALEQAKKVLDQ